MCEFRNNMTSNTFRYPTCVRSLLGVKRKRSLLFRDKEEMVMDFVGGNDNQNVSCVGLGGSLRTSSERSIFSHMIWHPPITSFLNR